MKTQAWREVPLERYRAVQTRVHSGRLEALIARWIFGGLVLKERQQNGMNQLPHGRMKAICDAAGLKSAEIKNRMQFAAEYRTKAEVAKALAEHGSWYAICSRGLGVRGGNARSDSLMSRELHATLGKIDHFVELLEAVQDNPHPDDQVMVRLRAAYDKLKHILESPTIAKVERVA